MGRSIFKHGGDGKRGRTTSWDALQAVDGGGGPPCSNVQNASNPSKRRLCRLKLRLFGLRLGGSGSACGLTREEESGGGEVTHEEMGRGAGFILLQRRHAYLGLCGNDTYGLAADRFHCTCLS
jgi:hypothetical protein